jgi:hypothetical protein
MNLHRKGPHHESHFALFHIAAWQIRDRRADGSHYSCCGFTVFQKPFLGTVNGQYRNCFGVRSFLLEIPEVKTCGAVMAATAHRPDALNVLRGRDPQNCLEHLRVLPRPRVVLPQQKSTATRRRADPPARFVCFGSLPLGMLSMYFTERRKTVRTLSAPATTPAPYGPQTVGEDFRCGSRTAVAGRLMAQPVYPQLRK